MNKASIDQLRQRIVDLLDNRGISLRTASAALGKNPAYLHQFLYKQSPRVMRGPERRKLAELLDVPEQTLMTDEQRATVEYLKRPAQSTHEAGRLPIVGYARGGSDVMTINPDHPMGSVDAPPSLIGVEDAYAIEVVGDSHEPRLRAGETAFVHPHKALTRDCDCVIELHDGSAIVASFSRMDEDRLHVKKLNPAKEQSWPRTEVKSVHRIVGADFR